MHDEELLYYSLKRIASTIERIINNSQAIDDSQYYVLSPAGMERLESTCMLLLAIGESIKGIDKMTRKQLLPNYKRRFLCKSSLICLSCSNIWSNFAPDFG